MSIKTQNNGIIPQNDTETNGIIPVFIRQNARKSPNRLHNQMKFSIFAYTSEIELMLERK